MTSFLRSCNVCECNLRRQQTHVRHTSRFPLGHPLPRAPPTRTQRHARVDNGKSPTPAQPNSRRTLLCAALLCAASRPARPPPSHLLEPAKRQPCRVELLCPRALTVASTSALPPQSPRRAVPLPHCHQPILPGLTPHPLPDRRHAAPTPVLRGRLADNHPCNKPRARARVFTSADSYRNAARVSCRSPTSLLLLISLGLRSLAKESLSPLSVCLFACVSFLHPFCDFSSSRKNN